jgi:hypothetical protein
MSVNPMAVGVVAAGGIGLLVLAMSASQIGNSLIVGGGALVMVLVMIWGTLICVSTSTRPAVEREVR